MRKLLSLIAVAALVGSLGLASTAWGAAVEWSGTMIVNIGTLPQFEHFGTGVATVNGSAGGIGHINTIAIPSGLTFTGGNNVPEAIPLTDPDNPTLISLRGTGMRVGRVAHPGMSTGSAVFNGISGGAPLGTKNTGQPPGAMKMCILFPGCANYLPIPFGSKGSQGVGIGGMVTINTFQNGAGFKLSIQAAPWTIGLASIKNVTTTTPNGGITTYTKTLQGFAHGPLSATSNTAAISGVLQLVTPVLIETNLGTPDTWQAVWVELRFHFIPEPGLLLLLGSGVAGLLMLGRSRMRK
jgi:hypothetical protein